ncbi:hypothetical protein Tco_0413679 [Tanacetum coccineum]
MISIKKCASENVSKEVKKTLDAPIIEDWFSDCDEDETVVLESLNVQKPKQADQPKKVIKRCIVGFEEDFDENFDDRMDGLLSNDPPLSKGYTIRSGEDSLELIELMDLCTKLIDKVTILENALKQSKESHAQTLTMLIKKVKRLMIFDPNEEDDIWLNQQYWELLRWKLHEYGGVHSLFLDGTSIQINMLVEKKYPLKKEILEKMIYLKIEAEEESTMEHELIKFIKSQITE